MDEDIEKLKSQISEMQGRIDFLEENFNRVQPWFLAAYGDMLNLHLAAAAQLSGDTEKAQKLAEAVKANYLLLSKAADDE